jgi:hypothetical protein
MPPDLSEKYAAAMAAEREAFQKMLDVDPASDAYPQLVSAWKDAMTATEKARQAMVLSFRAAPAKQ